MPVRLTKGLLKLCAVQTDGRNPAARPFSNTETFWRPVGVQADTYRSSEADEADFLFSYSTLSGNFNNIYIDYS